MPIYPCPKHWDRTSGFPTQNEGGVNKFQLLCKLFRTKDTHSMYAGALLMGPKQRHKALG